MKFFHDRFWDSVPEEWRDLLCALPNSVLQKLPLGYIEVISNTTIYLQKRMNGLKLLKISLRRVFN